MSDARVVLVESVPAAPGLFGATGWRAMSDAGTVLLRDPATHPSAPYLGLAELEVGRIPDGTFDVRDRRDLLATPGDVPDRKLATGLCDAAREHGPQTVLLGPGDEGLGRAVGLEAARREVEVEWVFLAELPAGGELLRLVAVEQRLRDPDGGCPWDLEQDHATLAPYLVEETYEALDAIAGGDDRDIAEELGDVLLQVVFHAQVAADRRAFTIDDVARGIADKLVNRHPHVFGDVDVEDADEVIANWDELKAAEKPERDGPFDGVPAAQPAVPLGAKVRSRAGRAGVPLPGPDGALDEVRAAADAVAGATDGGDDVRTEAVGELMRSVVWLAGSLGVDPELALREVVGRYRVRVEAAMQLAAGRGTPFAEMDTDARSDILAEARERHG